MKRSVRKLTRAAVAAALYAVLTVLLAPISYGPLQLRLSEALMLLPYFMPETAAGLVVGCFIVNTAGGYGVADMVFGTLATALTVYTIVFCGKKGGRFAVFVTILAPAVYNGVLVGAVLAYMTIEGGAFFTAYLVYAGQIALSELLIMTIIGLPAMRYLPKSRLFALINEKEKL